MTWLKERKNTKRRTTIYKTLHRKLNIEQHEPHWKPGVNSGAPEEYPVPALLMTTFIAVCFWLNWQHTRISKNIVYVINAFYLYYRIVTSNRTVNKWIYKNIRENRNGNQELTIQINW